MPRVRYVPELTTEDIVRAAKKLEEHGIEPRVMLLPIEEGSILDRELADFLGPKKKPGGVKKPREVKGVSDKAFAKLLEEAADMLTRKAWGSAQGRHFVALFAELHFRVYGVACAELGSKERVYATKLANDMLSKDFAGDAAMMATFIAWLWSREKEREEWRRNNQRSGSRIGWRYQFGRAALTDFRIEQARKATR
jgi:hypothetical protein